MSNRRRLPVRADPVLCESCGLPFGSVREMQGHWKSLPEGRLCLAVSSMRDRGFYRSRGAWRLPR